MSNAVQLQGYGYVADNDETLKSKSGNKFGGNFGTGLITHFAYNPNTAKEGEEVREALEITVKVGDKEYKNWISPITKVYGQGGVELTDKTSPEYIKKYNEEMSQQSGVITHHLKSLGVTPEQIKGIFTTPVTSFQDYATRLCSLLPVGYDKKPLDVFLEYQWNFGKKQDGSLNDKTYPTLPKNMKGGYYLCPAQPGVWEEKIAEDGSLTYVNATGNVHPFERDANFMAGNKGKQQILGQVSTENNPMAAGIAPGNGAAQATSWT